MSKKSKKAIVPKKQFKPSPAEIWSAALDLENEDCWEEAAAVWTRLAKMGSKKERADAAGRAAAARVRAEAKPAEPAPQDDEAPTANDAGDATSVDNAASVTAQLPSGADTGEPGATEAPVVVGAPNEPTPRRRRTELRPPAAPKEPDPSLPAVGTMLEKHDRKGQVRCQCQVVEGGVLYSRTTYKLFSAAALAASHDLGLKTKAVDGWSFWGLKTRTTPAGSKNALERLERAWKKYRERADAVAKSATGDDRDQVLDALRAQGTALLAIAKPAGE